MDPFAPRDPNDRENLRWGELIEREKLILMRWFQNELKRDKWKDIASFVCLDEHRQFGVNILNGKVNLDEYYVFIDFD